MTGIIKKSMNLSGHLTSVSLEQEFWTALKNITQKKGVSMRSIVQEIDQNRLKNDSIYNLSSSIRVFVLMYYLTLNGEGK